MKICDQYSHQQGLQKLIEKNNIYDEINIILEVDSLKFGKSSPRIIKSKINERFNHRGWADKVRVGNLKLTVNYLKSKVGVCFQIGNVARTYADILKLSQLNAKGIIDVGIIIVPHKLESKLMGTNYANYDRLSKEMAEFVDIISTPIVIIALSN